MKILYTALIGWVGCCLFSVNLFAQTDINPLVPKELADVHQQGEAYLLNLEYERALGYFEQALKINETFAPSLRGAGSCHLMLRRYGPAIDYLREAIAVDPNFSMAIYYELADLYYKTGDYQMSLNYFMQFEGILKFRDFEDFGYNGQAERENVKRYQTRLPENMRACRVAMDSIQFQNIDHVINLGKSINTAHDEYFPFVNNQEDLMYYTSRIDADHDENLLIARRNADRDGPWNYDGAMESFNTNQNEGMTTVVRDQRTVFFTACGREGVLGPCDLWEGRLKGRKIVDAKTVTGYTNSPDWESQASVSCDGTTLYFASNRPGGLGGTDIWTAQRLPDGRWGAPSNLGPNVNTPGDEEAPFITNDGDALYFSSTGHLGMGEQDIFQTRQTEPGRWSKPINLGPPVNSSYRELGLFLSADNKTGYFASDRAGGQGGMDIYKFELSDQLYSTPVTFLKGVVKDSLYGIPVANTQVFFGDRLPAMTDERGEFFLCVPAPVELNASVTRYDFQPYRKTFEVPEWNNREYYEIELRLQPIQTLQVAYGEEEKPRSDAQYFNENILFDKNAYGLSDRHRKQLQAFLESVLLDGKTVESVSIVGYADTDGADSYNLILSERRAKSVAIYLKEKGLRIDQVYLEGRGEIGGEQTKDFNRRVELKVVVR